MFLKPPTSLIKNQFLKQKEKQDEKKQNNPTAKQHLQGHRKLSHEGFYEGIPQV